MTDSQKFAKAAQAVKDNDPPIEINQHWVVKNTEGEVLARLRILAKYPDPGVGWIYAILGGKMHRIGVGTLGICPEFNLRYVYELEPQP